MHPDGSSNSSWMRSFWKLTIFMIGQKRRQPSEAPEASGAGRSRTVDDGVDSKSLDGDHSVSLLRYLTRSSWFRRKFSKNKNLPNDHDTASSESLESRAERSQSTIFHSNNDFFERQRHRYRRFCKNIIKRSRTTDYERTSGQDTGTDGVATEEDWKRLESSIARLLERLHDQPDQGPAFPDEECVICVTGRACMQTFPCGHKVLCKTCFVRTIQVALQERQLPLRCIVCRSRIVRLKQQPATCRVVLRQQPDPPGSYYLPPASSPSPPSGIRRPGYM